MDAAGALDSRWDQGIHTLANAGIAAAATVTAVTAALAGEGAAGAAVTAALSLGAGFVSIPVAGWVIAAGAGLTAAGIVIVKALKDAKVHRDEVVAAAQAAGFPNADEVPYFTVKVMDLASDGNLDKLQDLADKYVEKASKDQAKGNYDSNDVYRAGIVCGVLLTLAPERNIDGAEAVIGTVAEAKQSLQSTMKGNAVAQSFYARLNIEPESSTDWLLPVLGGIGLGLVAVFFLTRSR